MLTNALLISGGSGILSALTFLLSVMQGATLVLYLPLLPLLLVGFHFGFQKSVVAAAFGAAILLVANDPAVVALYALFLAVPALITSFFTLRHKSEAWYPVLRILTNLLVYAALMISLLAFSYQGIEGGIQGKIAAELSGSYEGLEDPNLAAMMKNILTHHTYFLVASTTWLWALMVYLMALVAHLILDSYRQNVRPAFSLSEGELPAWLLVALSAAALVSFSASGDLQFVARGVMLMFLLPYFVSGLVSIHRKTVGLPARALLLTVLYAVIIPTLYPILFIALYGVILQMKQFGKPTTVS